MYIATNVAKPANSAGGGSPKNPNVTIIAIKDITIFPVRDSKGILISGNIVLKAGANAISVYMTSSKIKAGYEPDGDIEDSQTFKHKFEGPHPGNSLAIKEFVQNWSGEPCIIIDGSCSDDFKTIYGTKCAPMYLKPSGKEENDSREHMLAFEQASKTTYLPAHYTGVVPSMVPFVVTDVTAVPVSTANGLVYQLPSSNNDENILFNTLSVNHDDVITLIGGGGINPDVLVLGATVRMPLLVNGAYWVGIKDAFINFRVFNNGMSSYAIEMSRG